MGKTKTGRLAPGTPVRVRRINGDFADGKTAGPPIAHLLPFGEFYLIAAEPGGEMPPWRGTGRKSRARQEWEAARAEIGMYERGQILLR